MVSKRALQQQQQQKQQQDSKHSSFDVKVPEPRYKGVRMRSWGKWVSEIRLPNTRDRLWLGSYATPEQAARAFDMAVICLRGPSSSATNFPNDPPPYAPRGLSLPHIQQLAAAHAAAHAPPATPLSLSPSLILPSNPNPNPNPPLLSSSSTSTSSPLASSSSSISHYPSPSPSSSSTSSLSTPSSPDTSDFQFPPLSSPSSPSPSHHLLFSLLDHPSDPSPSPSPHHIDWDSLSLPDPFLLHPLPTPHDDEFYEPALWNL